MTKQRQETSGLNSVAEKVWPEHESRPDPQVCLELTERFPDAVIFQDKNGTVQWLNSAAESLYGVSLLDVRGEKITDLWPFDAVVTKRSVPEDNQTPSVTQHKKFNTKLFWGQHNTIEVGGGENSRLVTICRDVNRNFTVKQGLHEKIEALHFAAHNDELTGLGNRRQIKDYLTSERVQRFIEAGRLGILKLDIDKFKEINDTLGHAAGDVALLHVANALIKVSGPNDLACRGGGDEFLLFCADIDGIETLLGRADLILRHIAEPLNWEDKSIICSSSIGAYLANGKTHDWKELIHRADQALYEAKAKGRGRAMVYTARLGAVQRAENNLIRDMRQAIAQDQLEMVLQPQLNLENGAFTACEALLRWHHHEHGALKPDDFLPVARSAGILADVDFHAMKLSLDALKALHESGHEHLKVMINVSSEVLAQENYCKVLNWSLQSRGLEASQIGVEITESAIGASRSTPVTEAIDQLKTMGIHVCLDDFGNGCTGLAQISTANIDTVKLDAGLTARLQDDNRRRAIARAMIDLCTDLKIDVVAKGLETREEVDALRAIGCQHVQGFAIARPMSVDEVSVFLETPLKF
ncbi:MAG: EAL domain-containing protein [Pseudomonadota bacterium]